MSQNDLALSHSAVPPIGTVVILSLVEPPIGILQGTDQIYALLEFKEIRWIGREIKSGFSLYSSSSSSGSGLPSWLDCSNNIQNSSIKTK